MSRTNPDPTPNPWVWTAPDYVNLAITISVAWNGATRALTSATVSRDSGCQYTKILFIDTATQVQKTLAAPADGRPPATYNAIQMASQGLHTIDDVLALEITAEP